MRKPHSIYLSEEEMRKTPNVQIGVSVNHKDIDGAHYLLRFRVKKLNLYDIYKAIEDNAFFAHIPHPNWIDHKSGYGVKFAWQYNTTHLIPFDFDLMKSKMEDYLDKLPERLIPTIAFKTRSNDDSARKYKYRFLYIFNEPFTSRAEYYNAYEALKQEIESYTNDFGEDEYAYALEPGSEKLRGQMQKPIRTNASSEILVFGKYFHKSDFDIKEVFTKLETGYDNDFHSEHLSKNMVDLVLHIPLERLWVAKHRNLSYTRSQFRNGFANVRGNLNYAEFIRKWTVDYEGHYIRGLWRKGEHRHHKIRYDAMVARFNDYMDNEHICKLEGEELFYILLDEVRNSFVTTDIGEKGKEIHFISSKFLLRVVDEIMSMDIEKIIAKVQDYNRKLDTTTETARRPLTRLDYLYWRDRHCDKDEAKKVIRHTSRFLKLLSLYDENHNTKENAELIKEKKSKNIGMGIPGCSEHCLNEFVKDCKSIVNYENRQSGNVHNDEALNAIIYGKVVVKNAFAYELDFCYRILLHLREKPMKMCKVRDIAASVGDFWKDVKTGKRNKPHNGRKGSAWTSILESEDSQLELKELINKVHNQYPDAKESSIKSWKYRKMKELCA